MAIFHNLKGGRHRQRFTVERGAGQPGASLVDPAAKAARRQKNKAAKAARRKAR
jgi:hypothetical protein